MAIARKNLLRIGKTMISSEVNGPGKRFVLWLQGCRLHCSGCFNQEFCDENGGALYSQNEILGKIGSAGHIEGVTFTGGEPFLQAGALETLACSLRAMNLSIVCYTGYTLAQIQHELPRGARGLLAQLDLLIDGPFVVAEQAPLLWRGSRNQNVVFLTDRYRHLNSAVCSEGTRGVEIQVGADQMTMTGIFQPEIWERLRKKLQSKDGC